MLLLKRFPPRLAGRIFLLFQFVSQFNNGDAQGIDIPFKVTNCDLILIFSELYSSCEMAGKGRQVCFKFLKHGFVSGWFVMCLR